MGLVDNNKYPRELFASPLNKHCCTSTLQLHSKRLNPSQVSLFGLLTIDIITDIEIWVSSLEHRDKFKPVAFRIKNMCNPIIFVIPHNLYTPYQKFRVFCC